MKTWIPVVIIMALAFLIFRQCNTITNLREDLKIQTMVPDTIYKDRPYKPITEYKFIEVPKVVTFWRTDTIEVERVELVENTITIIQKDSIKLDFNTNFLTHYPNNDKLIQGLFDRNKISLTVLTPEGNTVTKDYPVNYDRFRYNYVGNNLTYKKTGVFRNIRPSVEYMIRPVHNMHDFSIGLNYKTSKFNYEIGFNTYYYQMENVGFGYNPYFRLRYTF